MEPAHVVLAAEGEHDMTRSRSSLAAVSLLAGCVASHPESSPARAECFDYSRSVHMIGSVSLESSADAIALAGDYAYVLTQFAGLHVVDVSTPGDPVLVGQVDVPGQGRDVCVLGAHAYLACDAAGLQVVDLSDPSAPVLVGTLDTTGRAQGVAVVGSRVYVADGIAGLRICDVTDPEFPLLMGTLNTPGIAQHVALSGALAYVADDSNLLVVNVANPTSPSLVGVAFVGGPAYDVTLSGGRAFVTRAGGQAGLSILDLSNPASPLLLGGLELDRPAGGVVVVGNIAHVANGFDGIQLVDVSDPSSPAVIARVGVNETAAADVRWQDGVLYCAQGTRGLSVIDVDPPYTPQPSGTLSTEGVHFGADRLRSRIYLASHAGLEIVDASNPLSMTLLGVLPVFDHGAPVDVVASETTAYVAVTGTGEMWVVDVTSPDAPILQGAAPISSGNPQGIAWISGVVYVAAQEGNVEVIDVSDPTHPTLIASVATPGSPTNLVAHGDRAFVFDSEAGIQVLDVSDPTSPSIVGATSAVTYPQSGRVVGDFLYVAAGEAGLAVLDISTPETPVLLDTLPLIAAAREIAVMGGFAYVTAGGAGLQIVDIRNPWDLRLIGAADGSWAFGIVTTPGYLIVGNRDCVSAYPEHCFATEVASPNDEPPINALTVVADHNPFAPAHGPARIRFDLQAATDIRLQVIDAAGRVVRTISSGAASAGPHSSSWDGRGSNGQALPAGVYFYSLEAEGGRDSRRVVLVR